MFVSLLDLLFPKFCCGCNSIGTILCEKCYQKIPVNPAPIPLKLEPSYLKQVVTGSYYAPPIKNLIHELKYNSIKYAGVIAGRFLYYTTNIPITNCIVPVPLHTHRQQERGFNQAEEIATELGKLLSIPCYNLLERTVHTTNQAKLDKKARKENIKNQFCFNSNYDSLEASSILLVDDVVTTGSTMNECAKTIKENLDVKIFGCAVAFQG